MAPEKKKLFHPVPPHLLANARKLRQQMTDAEQLLWFCLRRKQLGAHFRRQHPIQQYVLDYYCSKARLVVELDGGQHNEEKAVLHDSERSAFLERRGIRVIRVWNDEVFKNLEGVLELIYHTLQERVEGWKPAIPPLPSPPPPGLRAEALRPAKAGEGT